MRSERSSAAEGRRGGSEERRPRRAAAVLLTAAVSGSGMLTGLAPARARAQEFDVDTHAPREVRFTSHTQLFQFHGVTHRINGYVLLDGPRLVAGMPTDSSQLYFQVDLGSLHTGIPMRDRHMDDQYLQVGKYPWAKFKGALTEVVADSAAGTLRVTARGTMSIHGVERVMTIPCDVKPVGSGYAARCTFPVLLSEFHIAIPRLMFLKLSNRIRLDVNFSVEPPKSGG